MTAQGRQVTIASNGNIGGARSKDFSLQPGEGIRSLTGLAIFYLGIMWFLPRHVPAIIAYLSYAATAVMIAAFFGYRIARKATQIRLNNAVSVPAIYEERYALYLRPFVSSGRLLVRNNLPRKVDRLIIGAWWDFELSMSFAIERLLRLVGVGHVSRAYGAAKVIASDDEWFERVQELCKHAQVIVIVPLDRPATLREASYVLGNSDLSGKTIVVMPPTSRRLTQLLCSIWRGSIKSSWERARKKLLAHGHQLPAYDPDGAFILRDRCLNAFRKLPFHDCNSSYFQGIVAYVTTGPISTSIADGQVLTDLAEKVEPARYRYDSVFSIVYALLIALFIRTFLFQPFNIPSGSMKATLLVGDYLFVSKDSYGYSHYSIPSSPQLFSGRIWSSDPNRGDVVVFRLPRDDSTDYIKRVIGLPGDRIQMKDGLLYINDTPVERQRMSEYVGEDPCGSDGGSISRVKRWKETLPNGVSYETLDCADNGYVDNTDVYNVPPGHFFMMGDNRDNSTDSRFLGQVGYVPQENLIGRAQMIFFSIAEGEHAWMFWRWPWAVRWGRLFKFVR